MAVKQVTKDNFKEAIKQGVNLVDFYADWCGPCKMIAPFVEEVSEEVKDVNFHKLNIDEAQDIAAEYGVMSIPTLIVFKDGQPIEQNVGFVPKEGIIKMIDKVK
jgi:thioredoxin 1